jgi:hypothetical protein
MSMTRISATAVMTLPASKTPATASASGGAQNDWVVPVQSPANPLVGLRRRDPFVMQRGPLYNETRFAPSSAVNQRNLLCKEHQKPM